MRPQRAARASSRPIRRHQTRRPGLLLLLRHEKLPRRHRSNTGDRRGLCRECPPKHRNRCLQPSTRRFEGDPVAGCPADFDWVAVLLQRARLNVDDGDQGSSQDEGGHHHAQARIKHMVLSGHRVWLSQGDNLGVRIDRQQLITADDEAMHQVGRITAERERAPRASFIESKTRQTRRNRLAKLPYIALDTALSGPPV